MTPEDPLVCWDCGTRLIQRPDGAEKPCGHSGTMVTPLSRFLLKAGDEESRRILSGLLGPMINEAAWIEREKNGQALTEEEVDIVKAVNFLRIIAPYMFTS